MLEAGRELDFAQKPFAAEGHGDLGAQRLEGDESFVAGIARQVDERHAAASQLPINDVMIGERGVQFCKGISHAN